MFREKLTFPMQSNHGTGMCVLNKHGLVVVSQWDACQLCVYSLTDGSLVRTVDIRVDDTKSADIGCEGVCASPDGGGVVIAETVNGRLQQLGVVTPVHVRFIGVGVLDSPECVDCNADYIVVSEPLYRRVSVLSWMHGRLRTRLDSQYHSPVQLGWPRGVRLLADGSGFVFADIWSHRLCVFTIDGTLVKTVKSDRGHLNQPCDVLECPSDGGFVVANSGSGDLTKLWPGGADEEVLGVREGGRHNHPVTLAMLPGGDISFRSNLRCCITVLHSPELRFGWLRACVTLAHST
jgi:hypothetical protein